VIVTTIKGDAVIDFGDGAVDQTDGIESMAAFVGGRLL
jgi:hypothetical protein